MNKELLKTLSYVFLAGIISGFVVYQTTTLPLKQRFDFSQTENNLQVESSKKELLNLQTQLNELKASSINTPVIKTAVKNTPIDSTIKIEKCKTQAKDYADKIATRDYLLAFEKASDEGDMESAMFYFDLSRKPEHPADYDSNYNSEYIKCLDNP